MKTKIVKRKAWSHPMTKETVEGSRAAAARHFAKSSRTKDEADEAFAARVAKIEGEVVEIDIEFEVADHAGGK